VIDLLETAHGVLSVVASHIAACEMTKVMDSFPSYMQSLFPPLALAA
jgi:uncharacterized protein (DUF2267 family)